MINCMLCVSLKSKKKEKERNGINEGVKNMTIYEIRGCEYIIVG